MSASTLRYEPRDDGIRAARALKQLAEHATVRSDSVARRWDNASDVALREEGDGRKRGARSWCERSAGADETRWEQDRDEWQHGKTLTWWTTSKEAVRSWRHRSGVYVTGAK